MTGALTAASAGVVASFCLEGGVPSGKYLPGAAAGRAAGTLGEDGAHHRRLEGFGLGLGRRIRLADALHGHADLAGAGIQLMAGGTVVGGDRRQR